MQTPKLAGEFGVGRCHERRHLLVTRLDELDFPFGAVERAEHAVDAVAGIAEDVAHAPVVQTLNKEIADGLGHVQTSGNAEPGVPINARGDYSDQCPR